MIGSRSKKLLFLLKGEKSINVIDIKAVHA